MRSTSRRNWSTSAAGLAIILAWAAFGPTVQTWASSAIQQAYNLVENGGTPLTRRSTLNFHGAGVVASDSGGVTDVNIPGGAVVPVVWDIGATFDGGGSAITSGAVTYFHYVHGACTINAWNVTVDTGTITIDVWKVANGTAIPTIANTITGSATPAIAANTAVHSTTLTGWTTAVAQNDVFGVSVTAISGATTASVDVQCTQN